jgi:hypothetical protein
MIMVPWLASTSSRRPSSPPSGGKALLQDFVLTAREQLFGTRRRERPYVIWGRDEQGERVQIRIYRLRK